MKRLALLLLVLFAATASAQTATYTDKLVLRTAPCAVTSGSGTPSGGNNCDLYVKSDGTLWEKVAGTWLAIALSDSMKLYVQSRMMNLVSNGSGLLGNNTNFSGLTFDATETYSGGGSFKATGAYSNVQTDELIPVDPSKGYRLIGWAKSTTLDSGKANAYLGLAFYDIDGLAVYPQCNMFQANTHTTLAVALKPGDTTITLTSATNWYNGSDTNKRHIILWGYKNSKGYTYPNYTYSRWSSVFYGTSVSHYQGNGAWAEGGISGNVITLTEAWPASLGNPDDPVDHAWPIGTPVSNNLSGATFHYIAAGNVQVPTTWTQYSGYSYGTVTDGTDYTYSFRPGTAYVKLLFLSNYATGSTNVTNWSDIWLSEVSGWNIEAATSAQPGIVSTATQTFGGAKTFGGATAVDSNLTWNGNYNWQFGSNTRQLAVGVGASSPYPLWLQSRTSGSVSNPLVFQPSGGNVGIGTLDPQRQLQINGNFRLAYDASNFFDMTVGTTGNISMLPGGGVVYLGTTQKANTLYAYDYITGHNNEYSGFGPSFVNVASVAYGANTGGASITSTGSYFMTNVGVGQKSASYPFDVYHARTSDTYDTVARFRTTGSYGGGTRVIFGDNGNSYIEQNSGYSTTGMRPGSYYADFNLANGTTGGSMGAMNFYTNDALAMKITPNGDVRITNGLYAKSFVADLEQALAGSQIISKSVAVLHGTFTCPTAGGAAGTLVVDDLPGADNMNVFEANDYVAVRSFSRAGGGLTISDCVGVVTVPDTTPYGYQSWTFTRPAGSSGGGMSGGGTVGTGGLAIDYGVSGNGYWETTAVDGTYGANSPYAQVVTWATSPVSANKTVRMRAGQLTGLTSTSEYGLFAGTYGASNGAFFRASNQNFDLHGITAKWWDTTTNVITIAPNSGSPYFGLGNSAPSSCCTMAGIFLGWDHAATKAKASFYSDANNFLTWDGAKLTWKGANSFLDSSGNLTATGGTIGGWTLGATSLVAGSGANTVGLDSGGTNPAIYAGSATPASAPFRVTNAGVMTATGANLSNGTITFDNGSYMKVSGTGFGSSNQFIEWYGPHQAALSSCTEANATYYLKTDGTAYFGGTLLAGVLQNKAVGTVLNNTNEVTIGPYSSNGNTITVTWGTDFYSTKSYLPGDAAGWTAADRTAPTSAYKLQRSINSGSYSDVSTLSCTGSVDAVSPNGVDPGYITKTLVCSGTYTDNGNSTDTRTYRMDFTSDSHMFVPGGVVRNNMAIQSIEQ